jgi:hypothetical protein
MKLCTPTDYSLTFIGSKFTKDISTGNLISIFSATVPQLEKLSYLTWRVEANIYLAVRRLTISLAYFPRLFLS